MYTNSLRDVIIYINYSLSGRRRTGTTSLCRDILSSAIDKIKIE